MKPQAAEAHDALAYDFDDVKPDSTVVTMRWDKVAVPFKVHVNVNEHRDSQHPSADCTGSISITGKAGTMRQATSWRTRSIWTKR